MAKDMLTRLLIRLSWVRPPHVPPSTVKKPCYQNGSGVFCFSSDVRVDVRRFRESSPTPDERKPARGGLWCLPHWQRMTSPRRQPVASQQPHSVTSSRCMQVWQVMASPARAARRAGHGQQRPRHQPHECAPGIQPVQGAGVRPGLSPPHPAGSLPFLALYGLRKLMASRAHAYCSRNWGRAGLSALPPGRQLRGGRAFAGSVAPGRINQTWQPPPENHRTFSPIYGGRRTSVTEFTEKGENGELRLFSSAIASPRLSPSHHAKPAR